VQGGAGKGGGGMRNQGVKVADLPEDATVVMTLISEAHPKASNVFAFRMIKGSPLRQLLELQEIWEDGFDGVPR
jgi:hypothetical protein